MPSQFSATKACRKCGHEGPVSDFQVRHDRGVVRYVSPCRRCAAQQSARYYYANHERQKARQRRYNKIRDPRIRLQTTMRRYGMSAADYDAMVARQSGLCAICRCPETSGHRSGRTKQLSVDHCHKTNRVRGLLCHHCNVAIGSLKDSPDLLRAAIAYLEKNAPTAA